MPAAITPTAFSGAAPPWSLLALDANFTAIQAALANPQIGIGVVTDSGGVNALTATPNPAWSSYVSGTPITVIPANTNTGNTTLNVSGLGTRSVLNPDGSQLLPGALQAGTPYLFMTGTSTFVLLGSSLVQATQGPGGTSFALRNKIINGDFHVDNYHAVNTSTAISTSPTLGPDRWQTYITFGTLGVERINSAIAYMPDAYAVAFSVGAARALLATDYIFFSQKIEGINIADLQWGTSFAKSITISFNFVANIANVVLPIAVSNGSQSRGYVTSITTGTANVVARYSVTIPGDVTGTWASDNTIGLWLYFTWGAGSNFQATANTWTAGNPLTVSGATYLLGTSSNTWQITNVQLEAGPAATPFERLGVDIQLQRCLRYAPIFNSVGTGSYLGTAWHFSATLAVINMQFLVPTRTTPTNISVSSASHFTVGNSTNTLVASAVAIGSFGSTTGCSLNLTIAGGSANLVGYAYFNNASGQLIFTGCEL